MDFLKKVFGAKAVGGLVRQPFVSTVTSKYNNSSLTPGNRTNGLSEYKNWAYGCINARATEISFTDLKLMKGPKRDAANSDRIFEHEVLTLLDKVNTGMTKHDLFFYTQAFKDLDGNCYWYLARDNKGEGEIKDIYVLRPDRMDIVLDPENPLLVKGYIYRIDFKTQIPFNAKEILHFKYFNPLGNHPFPHKGMGVVQGAAWAIDTDNEARTWNYNFFKKSARPDGILLQKGDGVASAEDHKRLEEEWTEKFGGSENNGKVAFLSGGLEWKEIQRSQKDMDFINQRTFSRDEILALFRTPKSILGITDDVNRANADASIYVFMRNTIKPLMQQLADTLTEFLLPDYGDDLWFDFTSPVPEDRTAVTSEYASGSNVWLTRNEIRQREGLAPTENGDNFMDDFGNIIDTVKPDTGSKSKKPKPAQSKKQEKTEKKSDSVAEKNVDAFISKMPTQMEIKTVTDDARKTYIADWVKAVDSFAAPLKKKLKVYFDLQMQEVIANLKEEMKGLDAKEFRYKAVSGILFDEEKAIKSGISLITPFLRDYVKRAGDRAARLVGGQFDDGTTAVSSFISQRGKYFAETINATTADDLTRTLKEGIANGETVSELSERIAVVYKQAEDYRTNMIARTEVSASANEGAKLAYTQAGVKKWQWQVVDPEDEDCKENEGQIVEIGEQFNDGSTQPPDPHPNCVCTTIPIF